MSRRKENLIGLNCHSLTVTEQSTGRSWWAACRNCETSRRYRSDRLKNGAARCGVCDAERRAKHGRTRGGRRDYLYSLWVNIRQRMTRPKYAILSPAFDPMWQQDHEAFRQHVLSTLGERPTPQHTLERTNGKLGYLAGNLKWATAREQNRNRSNVRRYALAPGATAHTVPEWAEYFTQLTCQPWTARKIHTLLRHLTLPQIFNALHPDAPAPHVLEAARLRRIAEAERRAAEESFSGLAPDGLSQFHPTGADDGGESELIDWD